MLEDEPVIISEKDFTPTPSPSPVPSDAEGIEGRDDAADSVDTAKPASAGGELDSTAVVSDDEGGAEIMPSSTPSDDVAVPTAEDVTTVEELALSISGKGADVVSGGVRDGEADDDEATEDDDGTAPPAVPSARQIVSIGGAEDSFEFKFHEEELNAILSKVPPGWKVCVVSVVGAFRTGKSFLLSWFLRYLESVCVQKDSETKSDDDGSDTADSARRWFERVQTLNQKEGSFDWRGGSARNTTGMWMWSEPYFLPRGDGDDVAVLLVDTQGMFDHETTVGLTAAIFGLSTLLSSYQIYNVDKRIQEDNLQQLALFSEYGRMAFEMEEKAASMGVKVTSAEELVEKGLTGTAGKKELSSTTSKKMVPVTKEPPFQKIEFLVRDWQNFETEDDDDVASMEEEMAAYLEEVTRVRDATDLKETREQISSCFGDVSCFMMTHPGFAVTRNKYVGDVSSVEPLFLRLLDRYCQRVFDTEGIDGAPPRLRPKTISGRELSAVELGTYIKTYAEMFEQIGANFPKAETMLEATSKANNVNAVNAGMEQYMGVMTLVAGAKVQDYHQQHIITAKHNEAKKKALLVFDEMASFGNRTAIDESRRKILQKIDEELEVFVQLNDGRNPLLGFETYVLPLIVAAISFVLRWVADFSCSSWSQTCRASSEILSHVYMVVFFFLVIVASTKMKQIMDLIERVKTAIRLMTETPSKEKKD